MATGAGSLNKTRATLMSPTNIPGSVDVTVIMLSYALKVRSRRFVLAFAAGSVATAVHGAMVPAYPIRAMETIQAVIRQSRFMVR